MRAKQLAAEGGRKPEPPWYQATKVVPDLLQPDPKKKIKYTWNAWNMERRDSATFVGSMKPD